MARKSKKKSTKKRKPAAKRTAGATVKLSDDGRGNVAIDVGAGKRSAHGLQAAENEAALHECIGRLVRHVLE